MPYQTAKAASDVTSSAYVMMISKATGVHYDMEFCSKQSASPSLKPSHGPDMVPASKSNQTAEKSEARLLEPAGEVRTDFRIVKSLEDSYWRFRALTCGQAGLQHTRLTFVSY